MCVCSSPSSSCCMCNIFFLLTRTMSFSLPPDVRYDLATFAFVHDPLHPGSYRQRLLLFARDRDDRLIYVLRQRAHAWMAHVDNVTETRRMREIMERKKKKHTGSSREISKIEEAYQRDVHHMHRRDVRFATQLETLYQKERRLGQAESKMLSETDKASELGTRKGYTGRIRMTDVKSVNYGTSTFSTIQLNFSNVLFAKGQGKLKLLFTSFSEWLKVKRRLDAIFG